MSFLSSLIAFFKRISGRFVKKQDDYSFFVRLLREVGQKTTLSLSTKQQMKRKLLRSVFSGEPAMTDAYGIFRPVVSLLHTVGHAVRLSPVSKQHFWANISELILWQDFHAPATSFSFFGQMRRHLATAVFFLFLTGGTLSFVFEVNEVSAARLTYLAVTSGSVTVQHADTLFTNVDRMYLEEGDVIRTGPDGSATIFYMDGSVSRLSPSTTVSLELLYLDPEHQTNTKVRVQVLRGRVWSHVGDYAPQTGLFQVFSPLADAVIQGVQQGSFDVNVDEDGAMRVLAADNVVSVIVSETTQTTLLAGDVMTFSGTATPTIHSSDVVLDVDQWVTQNEAEDQTYADSLALYYEKEAEFKAGFLPGNPLYGLKTLSEDAQLLLSFDAISDIATKFSLAENRLNEAIALANKEKDVEALAMIDEYNTIMHAVLVDLSALRDKESLDDYTQEDLDVFQKTVSGLLGSQYRALMTMNSRTEIAVVAQVTADTQKLLLQLQEEHSSVVAQASSILFTAKKALDSGDESLALEYLSQYRNEGLSIGVDVSLIDPANRSQAVTEMITRKTEDVWFLSSLANGNTDENVQDALAKTITATIAQVNRILIGLVQSSDDLALSFAVVDVKAFDRASQLELLDLLKGDATLPPVVLSRLEAFLQALDGTVQVNTVSTLAPVVNTPTTEEPTITVVP